VADRCSCRRSTRDVARWLLALAAGASLPAARASAQPGAVRLHDAFAGEMGGQLVIGNARLRLTFDHATGAWSGLYADGVPGSLIRPDGTAALDVRIDGTWVGARARPRLLGYATGVDRGGTGVVLRLRYALGTGDELTGVYRVAPGAGAVERWAELQAPAPAAGRGGRRTRRLEEFRFVLPGVAVGDPAGNAVEVPGPWFPATYVRPGTPYPSLADSLADTTLTFHGAPDGGFGVLALANARLGVALASWLDTGGGETNYHPSLRGRGGRLDFVFADHRAYALVPHGRGESDVQHMEVARGGARAAYGTYRAMVERTMPLAARTPAWAREMVLLEVYPRYYKGGFREIAERLPFYRDVGFNTVYLMPHWQGGYSPVDLYAVDSALGTPAELRALVDAAHRLGMRVLFDMVIHGFNERSAVPRRHPELFVRDTAGRLARHPTWKSLSTDWASPAYAQYMADYVRHELAAYDVDGYRVDAASYKGPNWDPHAPYPAYASGARSPAVMRRLLDALQARKPGAVLLSEVFGPVFYAVSNLAHDNQTEAGQWLVEALAAGRVTAADYKAHMASVQALLPAGANRVFFARNHDTSWFYRFGGYTPRFLALDAIHALTAIPEVFAGDPEHGPNPDHAPGVWAHYRALFGLRRAYPELARGALLLDEVRSDNPHVFTALRQLGDSVVLVAVSLSDRPETAEVTLDAGLPATGPFALHDAVTRSAVRAEDVGGAGRRFRVTLRPFQAAVGRAPW